MERKAGGSLNNRPGYGQQEFEKDLSFTREQLLKIDKGIVLPDSLRGERLRPSIEAVYLPGGVRKIQQEDVLPYRAVWKSALGYAAAFALIVGAFYGLGINRTADKGLVDGAIDIPDNSLLIVSDEDVGGAPDEARNVSGESRQFSEADSSMIDTAGLDQSQLQDTEKGSDPGVQDSAAEDIEPYMDYVGGSGKATRIKSIEGYTFYSRQSVAGDPDKDAPISLEMVDAVSGQLISILELPEVGRVLDLYMEQGILTILGNLTGESKGISVLVFDITDSQTPQETFRFIQPGEYMASHYFEGIMTEATLCHGGEEPGIRVAEGEAWRWNPADESYELVNHVSESYMLVTAVNVQSGSHSSVIFLGGDDGITLYDTDGYLTYSSALPEKPEQITIGMAKILLEGLAITLDNK